ncbi:MAG: hypothetical protein UU98_C0044G0012 [Parcubacteria group bacterium GW2011_GWD2_42_14]|nr:MAG: hypothetical protein UU98_C0044G0012 [Parcubacteria group bacterium GW2011_GWD2_42_14]
MKLRKSDLHFLNTHAVKIEDVWRCKQTNQPISFVERSSFLKRKQGKLFERVALITFVHCPSCSSPDYALPPVEIAYPDDEIIDFDDYCTPYSTSESVITGHICPT